MKILKFAIVFAIFEFISDEVFRCIIGYSTLEFWGWFIFVFLLFMGFAMKYKDALIDSMFD